MKKLFPFLLLLFATLSVRADKLSNLTQTQLIRSNSLFYVVTNAGVADGSRYIQAYDIVEQLQLLPNWPAGGTNNADYVTALTALTNTINTVSNRATSLESQTNALGSRISTIEGSTNSFAKLTAATELTNTVNTVSNRTWAADNWNTNRVNAALTNNNAGAVTLSSTLSAQSTTVSALTVQNVTDALAFFDDGGLASELVIGSGLSLDTGSGTLSATAVSGTNFAGIIITNALERVATNIVGTNIVVDFAGRGLVRGILTNISQIVFTNVPSAGSPSRWVHVEIFNPSNYAVLIATSSIVQVFDPIVIATNKPSSLWYHFDTTNVLVSSGSEEYTGSGPTALQTNAALHTPSINGQTLAAGTSILTNANAFQPASATLTNLASNPYVAYTNVLTKTSSTVSGAGSGSTNYLLTLSTNALNDFYLGSSNVHIYTVAGSTLGSPIYWNAIVTNLSASTWGINFASGTNRWKFSGVYGTNAPTVLTNNTALMLSGRSDGTNTLVGYTYFAPGL